VGGGDGGPTRGGAGRRAAGQGLAVLKLGLRGRFRGLVSSIRRVTLPRDAPRPAP